MAKTRLIPLGGGLFRVVRNRRRQPISTRPVREPDPLSAVEELTQLTEEMGLYDSARVANPTVTRVQTTTGSHIEPPMDDSRPEIEKLRWHLAVALHDAGMPGDLISIREDTSRFGRKAYALEWARGGMSSMDYGSMWTLINGISMGFDFAADRKAVG